MARDATDGGFDFELLVDPEANLYRALGIGRMRLVDFLRPTVAQNYVRAFRRGGRQGRMTGDPKRLSGVAVVDAGGDVRWQYQASVLGDYPEIDAVLDQLAGVVD